MLYPTFIYHLMFIFLFFLTIYTFDWKRENVYRAMLVYIIFLIVLGGLRGDFTTDYPHYVAYYERVAYSSITNFFEIPGEFGFLLLNFILSRLFESPVPFFVVCMSIILMPVYVFSKKTQNPFLFMTFYLSFCIMIQSYNVMRYVMMASLFLFAFEWMKKGELWKYLVYVAFLSTIHMTALFLIPFYFILRLNINKKTVLLHLAIIGFIILLLNPLMDYFDELLYEAKFASRDVGQVGVNSIKDIVVPLLFFLFFLFVHVFCPQKELCKENVENNILVNGGIYWIASFVFSQQIPILGRFSYVFFPFMAMGFVNDLMSYPREQKIIFTYLVFCFCSVYYFVFGQYFKEFYFYWQSSQL